MNSEYFVQLGEESPMMVLAAWGPMIEKGSRTECCFEARKELFTEGVNM